MDCSDSTALGHEARRKLYEYVDRHGTVAPGDVRNHLGIDASAFRHHVAILRRDGHLEKVDGGLRVTIDSY